MFPRGLVIAIVVGVLAGGIFGAIFIKLNDPTQLVFVEGPSLSIVTEKIDFNLDEDITIRLVNSGTVPLQFSDKINGLKITGMDGTLLYTLPEPHLRPAIEPKEEVLISWNQIKNDGDKVLHGRYKITSKAFDNDENVIQKSITINILK